MSRKRHNNSARTINWYTHKCFSKTFERAIYLARRIMYDFKSHYTTWIPNYLQIFHTRGNHWVTITTIGCTKDNIVVFDSLYDDIDDEQSI